MVAPQDESSVQLLSEECSPHLHSEAKSIIFRAHSDQAAASAAAAGSVAVRTILICTCVIHTKQQWQWHC